MISEPDSIPVLDFNDFHSSSLKKNEFSKHLGEAYERIGFAAIKNHGISPKLMDELYDVIRQFFALDDSQKRELEIEELFGQRGYIRKGRERAKGRSTGDLKEFFHVGQPNQSKLPAYPENIWPSSLPHMETLLVSTFQRLEQIGIEILRAIAIYLGLNEDFFDHKVRNGNSILRAIHYYPLDPETVPSGAVRAAEHGDINFITLLMGASAEGLQVQRRDGRWIEATSDHDQIIINVGDMLSRLTNNQLRSTVHRVVNPPAEKMGTSRYSLPFFMHPISSMPLNCLPQCVNSSHPKLYDDITAGEFLDQRLIEIGLKK